MDKVAGHILMATMTCRLAGKVSKDSIDFLTRQIRAIESVVEKKMELRNKYSYLLTIPGVGKMLGLTIMLETGPISRFAKVGNYVSYCRKVSSKWISNDKVKGKGNKKSGNKYLAWAFSEVMEIARRYDARVRAYYNRKMQRTNKMVAYNALSHKLARAAYYIMRTEFPLCRRNVLYRGLAGVVNLQRVGKTTDLIGNHPPNIYKVINIFTARVVSHEGAG